MNILQGYYQKKTFYVQITMVLGDIDAKKTRKQTSHKIFPQGLIVNSSLLWEFMVQNFCKHLFSGGKSRKKTISVITITFSLQKICQNYSFHELTPKLVSILANIILHSWDISFHYFIYKFIEITRNNCVKTKKESLDIY